MFKDLLDKYLIGDITEKEIQILEQYMKLPENKKKFEKLLTTEQKIWYATNSTDKSFVLKKINRKIKNRYFKKIYNFSAAAIIFLAFFYAYTQFYNVNDSTLENNIVLEFMDGSFRTINDKVERNIYNNKRQLIAKLQHGVLSFVEQKQKSVNYKLKVTNGNNFKVKLYDGSLIHINSGSDLKFPSSFSDNTEREVFLNGEAYFDIIKNEKSPFIVNFSEYEVIVLGTKFNVKAYNNELNSITLEEGSVSVDNSQDNSINEANKIIEPGQELNIKKDNNYEINTVNVQNSLGWTKGILSYDNEQFGDIIKSLERHYNIRIENSAPEISTIRYTGKFKNKSIFEILDTFKELSDFKYTVDSNKLIIIN